MISSVSLKVDVSNLCMPCSFLGLSRECVVEEKKICCSSAHPLRKEAILVTADP